MGNLLRGSRRGTTEKTRLVVPSHLIPDDINPKEHPNRQYFNNKIKTTKYTVWSFLPKNIFEQFHRCANLYFLFIVLLNWIPEVNAFTKEVAMIPVIFVLGVTAVKDGFEDYRRYRADKKVNHLTCRVFSRKENSYVPREWKDVHVGDIIHLSCYEVIPADIILLYSSDEQGISYLDTSNLDGENNLKQRQVVSGVCQPGTVFHPTDFNSSVECDVPSIEINKFHGNICSPLGDKTTINKNNLLLRGCILRNTDYIEGIVVYAGHETKALLNDRGPRYKRSKMERYINRDVIWCAIILFVLCFFCALGSGIWLTTFRNSKEVMYLPFDSLDKYSPAYQSFIVFWTYVILFQVMIPLSLYVTIELVKLGQVYFIHQDKELYDPGSDRSVECRALNITEDLGQVEYVFSDKTGTLTENQMVFKKCTIGGFDYAHSTFGGLCLQAEGLVIDPRLQCQIHDSMTTSVTDVHPQMPASMRHIHHFFLLMAICNTVVVSRPHHDKMDQTGHIESEHSQGNIKSQSTDKYVRLEEEASPQKGKKDKPKESSFRRAQNLSTTAEDGYEKMSDRSSTNGSTSDCRLSESASHTTMTDTSDITEKHYEAESPDELALVRAAYAYGCKLLKRTPDTVTVWLPGEGEVVIRIVHILPFDPVRKCMSVIIQHPHTGELLLYSKGADTAILNNLLPSYTDRHGGDGEEQDILRRTQDHLLHYAKKGLRTLCMAKKVISDQEYKSWLLVQREAENAIQRREHLLFESACMIETNLELLGATGIEDQLQTAVPETVAALRAAGMKVWLLTGDKQETALNVAYSCKLISYEHDLICLNGRNKKMTHDLIQGHIEMLGKKTTNDQDPLQLPEVSTLPAHPFYPRKTDVALVIDGKTLDYALEKEMEADFLNLTQHCSSVLCCRATPIQKARVVKLVRDKLKKLTLAIGDGANDVSMIQTADVGVGITGQEGMQAVMSSDFALPRFRFLKRLLLVHGHWSYDRLAKMTLYMFYKNAVYIFLLMWFQIFNGFSGQSMIDQFNLLFFNLIYTALPPFIMGIFDKDLSDRMLMAAPHLYKQGPADEMYRFRSYWIVIADCIYQSLAMFFVPYMVFRDSDVGLWEFGTLCNATSVYVALIHACIETKSWNIVHCLATVLSCVAMWGFCLVFTTICVTCNHPFNGYWVTQMSFMSFSHWFAAALTIIVALAPRVIIRSLQGSLWPSPCLAARQMDKKKQYPNEAQFIASWSSSSSESSTIQRRHHVSNT